MSWDFFRVNDVRAAKPHHCQQCGKEIAKGELHHYAAGKFDSDFFAYREHVECRAAWAEYSEDDLRWDNTAPFLHDADDLIASKDWFKQNHPAVFARLWPEQPSPPAGAA